MPAFPDGMHSGVVVPLDRANVDTDAIFPKQYGRGIAGSGFGPVLFDSWRYLDPGELTSDHSKRRKNAAFVLNRAELQGASVLLARQNFGCGSSREHAVWALRDYGFKAVLAPSFGDIFRQNCALNGVAAIVIGTAEVDRLFALSAVQVLRASINVHSGQFECGGLTPHFELSARERLLLTQDVDWIGATLSHRERIAAFENARVSRQPWLTKILEH